MNQSDNVVLRLKQRLADARRAGFAVRMEMLEDEQPTWCQIGQSRVLFVNLSHTAAEQLAQLDETLRDFAASAACDNPLARSKLAGQDTRAA